MLRSLFRSVIVRSAPVHARLRGVALALAAVTAVPQAAGAEGFRVLVTDMVAARHYEKAHVPNASPTSAPSGSARPARGPLITAREWADYTRAFVAADGRVVDWENRGVSHSEGQGYGMILAVHAEDRATFDRIWGFTRRELQIRDDALLAWRYMPGAFPSVGDRNNATDGDILVAYALLRAAATWHVPAYADAATRMVRDIGRELIAWEGGRPILKPAAYGFDETAGNSGPVVNLSYYFYAAFDLFEVVQPDYPWRELAEAGKTLTARAQVGRSRLVPDWISVSRGDVSLAQGFAPRASYDAVRIPLYMAYAGMTDADVSIQDAVWNVQGPGMPMERNLVSDVVTGRMQDPGYRMVAALTACLARQAPLPPALTRYRSTTYFASSLHLLGLVAVRHGGVCANGSHVGM